MSRARICPPNVDTLREAAQLLLRGEVVGMPTETVYGLAGNVFDERALERIFSVKERPTFDPLIVHVSPSLLGGKPLEGLERLDLVDTTEFSPLARRRVEALAQAFWPGPLTIVLPKTSRVPDLATSGLGTVGVRVPRHPVAQKLIEATGMPLAAPSANRFGRISPTRAAHVLSELGDRIDLIIDGGDCEIGVESSVVSVGVDGLVRLLRPGGVAVAALESVTGSPVHLAIGPQDGTLSLSAPGMLASHYAPGKRMHRLPAAVSELTALQLSTLLRGQPPQLPLGVLLLSGDAKTLGQELSVRTGHPVIAFSLSLSGSLSEAARNLFARLRELDESTAELLFTEPCEIKTGLGHAIADRLSRATAGRT